MLSVEAFHNEALAHQHSTNNFKIKEVKTLYYGKKVTNGPYTVVSTF